MDEKLKRLENESELGYMARLYRSKLELGLSAIEINDIINAELNSKYAPSTTRCNSANYNVGWIEAIDKYANENTNDDYLKELEEKRVEIEKERKKLQATKIEYHRNLRKDSRFELFYENIRDSKDRLPLPEFEDILINDSEEGEYVLSLADIHYGATFESENNIYSREEVKRRFEVLLCRTIKLIQRNNIEKINVLEMGDTIQGMLRISDVSLNDIPVVDSVVEISRLIASFLNELSKYTYVEYRHTMASNHSQNRYLGTKASEMPNEDMERIIGNYIKDLVSNNSRIEIILSDKDYNSFELCGQKILSLHGHQVKSVKNTIKDYSMLHKIWYDIAFVAHFHSGQSMSVGELNGNTKIIVCNSFIGSDPYSDSLKLGAKGICELFKIERNQGITETYTMVLN